MIRRGSGQRVDRFDRVEPIHRSARGARPPPGRKAASMTDHLGVGQQWIGVERKDDRSLIELEREIDVATSCRLQPRKPVLVADRFVRDPLRSRETCSKFGGQARQGGRGKRFGEDGETGAAVGAMSLGQLTPGSHEVAPGFRLSLQPGCL